MKKLPRLVVAIAFTITALTVGLTSASASGTPVAPPPPDPTVHTAAVNPGLPHLTPRPPQRAETLFVPVTPCRAVDTRNSGAGGPLKNGATRAYYIAGTVGFTTQGGKNGGCSVPNGAKAVAAVITAVNPSNLGYFKAYPAALTAPNSSVLNYPAGHTSGTGASLAISVSSGPQLKVFNFGGPTDLTIDVTGYYTEQLEGMVDTGGQPYQGSSRLVSSSRLSAGVYRLNWDSDVSYCSATAAPYPLSGILYYAAAYNYAGVSTYVSVWTLSPTTHLPVYTDDYVYVTVNC